MPNEAVSIGERIKERRKLLKISPDKLASDSGIARAVINSIERDEVDDPELITIIAGVLNVPAGYLLSGETLGTRVKDRRKELGMSQGSLAAKANLKQPTISSLERGESNTSGSIAKIASALNVSALWLETGLGDKEEHTTSHGFRRACENGEFETEYEIKLVEAKGNCGNGRHQITAPNEAADPIIKKERWFVRFNAEPGKVFAMIADGPSMSNFIMHGDLMFFNVNVDHPNSGAICAIDTLDGLRVKRVFKRADGGIILSSDNSDKTIYPDEVYTAQQVPNIIFKGHFISREG